MRIQYEHKANIEMDFSIEDQEYLVSFTVTDKWNVYLQDIRNSRLNTVYWSAHRQNKCLQRPKKVSYENGEPYIKWGTFRFIFDDEPLKAAILRCAKEINPKELFQKFNNIL